MTTDVLTVVPNLEQSWSPPTPPPPRKGRHAGPSTPLPVLGLGVLSVAMRLLGVLMVSVVAQASVIGALQHVRAQKLAYTDLRNQLALATAPVGPVDLEGDPLALGAPVALLEIPELGLRQVVLQGTTPAVLADGPGHRRDSVMPGQPGSSVIYGRRASYGGPFKGIERLSAGAVIKVTTGQGRSTYKVTGRRLAGSPLPATPAAGKARLTLATATGSPFVPNGVLRIDAESVTPLYPLPNAALPAVSASEQALAGDTMAWVPVVLYGQMLLVAVLAFVWALKRWGARQAWLVGVPLLLALGLTVADHANQLLPNLT